MSGSPWYIDWFGSPFYQKLHSEKNGQEVFNFLDLLLSQVAPARHGRVFDTACATGGDSKYIASLGFDVIGVDLSPANIESAKQSENNNLQYFIHDIRLPFYSNYFDIALNLFPGFGYYRTRREHEAAIRTVSKSLRPGGHLVLEYLNVHYAAVQLKASEVKEIDGSRFDIHRWQDDDHFFSRVTVADPSLLKPLEFTEQYSKFTLGDFTDMLSFQGMQVQAVFGDYELGEYDNNRSPRLILMAEKKNEPPADKEKRLYSDGRRTDSLT